jgi:hypothetical protein
MRPTRVVIVVLVTVLLTVLATEATMRSGVITPKAEWLRWLPDKVWSGERPLDVPMLSELIAGSDDPLASIAAYFEREQDRLAAVFGERDRDRLAALFGMYIVHVQIPYGRVSNEPTTISEYVLSERSHCGVYSVAQSWIYEALGLRWRIIHVDDTHGYTEVMINGVWETFDGMSNVWIDRGIEELINGSERTYRYLYTPILDANTPDIYRAHIEEGWGVLSVRRNMPLWGLEADVRTPASWLVYASGE